MVLKFMVRKIKFQKWSSKTLWVHKFWVQKFAELKFVLLIQVKKFGQKKKFGPRNVWGKWRLVQKEMLAQKKFGWPKQMSLTFGICCPRRNVGPEKFGWPKQMSPQHLESVLVVPSSLPLNFCENWISNNWDIADIEFVVDGWL